MISGLPTRIFTLAASLVSLSLFHSFAFAQSTAAAQHAMRVETGLLPAVVVRGGPSSSLTLSAEMARLHVPGVSIAVIHNGKIEWAKGFGIKNPGGAAVTPETLFQAGSVSKPIAALCVLRLAQQGTISLDEDVNRILHSWQLPSNRFTAERAVTPRALLSHTAGTGTHGFEGYRSGAPVPSLTEVLNGTSPANSEGVVVTQAVGEQYRYSGGGYTILQQLVMDATHTPFPALMKHCVFDPIGMRRSTFSQPLETSKLKSAALPYDSAGRPVAGGPHTYPELAAAGLWTNSTDLAKYVMEVQRSLSGKANHVLSEAMTRTMLEPVKGDWGLGLQIGGSLNGRYFYHDGSNHGYKATLVGYEHSGDGAVVLTNGDGGYQLGLEIVRAIAKEYRWPDFHPVERATVPMSPAAGEQFIGHYIIKDLGTFEIRKEGRGLVAEIYAGMVDPLLASSDRSFFITSQDIEINFASAVDPGAGEIKAGTFQAAFKRVP